MEGSTRLKALDTSIELDIRLKNVGKAFYYKIALENIFVKPCYLWQHAMSLLLLFYKNDCTFESVSGLVSN